MERILALQSLGSEEMFKDVLGSSNSEGCSSESNAGCSSTSNQCGGGNQTIEGW